MSTAAAPPAPQPVAPQVVEPPAPDEDFDYHACLVTPEMARTFVRDHPDRLMKRCSNFGFTPLHYACDEPKDLEVIKILVEACPAALHELTYFGYSPLDLAMASIGEDGRSEKIDSTVDPAELLAFILSKYTGEKLCVKPGYTKCSLEPDTTAVLGQSPTIKVLDLSRVCLTKEGFIAFLNVMETNEVMEDLTLNFFEDIDEQACNAMRSMLIRNTVLESLTLRVRFFRKETLQLVQSMLDEAMEMNETLCCLSLNYVPQAQLALFSQEKHIEDREAYYYYRRERRNEGEGIISRVKIDQYIEVNKAGRKKLRNPNLSKLDLSFILSGSNNANTTYVMLQMVPHVLSAISETDSDK